MTGNNEIVDKNLGLAIENKPNVIFHDRWSKKRFGPVHGSFYPGQVSKKGNSVVNDIRFNRMELAGSLGDIGTLLPIAITMILVNGLDPAGLFHGRGPPVGGR